MIFGSTSVFDHLNRYISTHLMHVEGLCDQVAYDLSIALIRN
jgi:hypothetical protein